MPCKFGYVAALFGVVTLSACNRYPGVETYSVGPVGQARIAEAIVVSVREAPIQTDGARGGVTGAGLGAGTGALMGNNLPAAVTLAVGGAIVGAAAGVLAEHASNRQQAFQYDVQTATGHQLTLSQPGERPIAAGTPVLVIYGNPMRIVVRN